MGRNQTTNSSNYTTSTRDTWQSVDSYESRSTAPSSVSDGSKPSPKIVGMRAPRYEPEARFEEDLSPSTSVYPRSSVDTYSSKASDGEAVEDSDAEEIVDYPEIPPLPAYHHEITDTNVRPSTPEDFAALFPSMDRLSIRHDDFTEDGNMNLRVDTVVGGRRRKTIQLFHLRMYDLNKREFSLRRYCRDSGREVCNSKRKYIETNTEEHHNHQVLPRTMSAMKTITSGRPQMKRRNTGSSTMSTRSRPGTSYSAEADDEFAEAFESSLSLDKKPKVRAIPTNTIKLEFSNYARVDVTRRGSKNAKRYEFEWWGHKYAWKRVLDKLTGVISFHLLRDGNHTAPVAHIVPETRAPNQVDEDEDAGGWVPPCYMWISDKSLINAMTDVADVVIATGLMALVDDCIKQRWQSKKANHHSHLSLSSSPRSLVQHIFNRRNSDHHPSSPLRSVAAY